MKFAIMKPAKRLGSQCNELPKTDVENIIIRLMGPKKLGSQPFQDIELEFTSSSRAAAFVSWQLKFGSPFSENETLYVTFCTSSLSIPEIGTLNEPSHIVDITAQRLTIADAVVQEPMHTVKRFNTTMLL
jgi:hypothetical protein